MYYEEQWVDGALCWRTSPNGAWTRYTANELAHRYESAEKRASDAQATVEALQAEKLMLERGVSAQSALIDDLQSQLIQRTAALEAVQHERDEANSHVKFLGATKQANGSFCLDMKKYHARYRCGRHRDDPWKGIDTEIDCFVCLKHALDAEREKVKGLEDEGVKLFEWRLALHSLTPGGSEFCTPDACEQWVRKNRTSQHEYIIEQIKQRKGLQTQLSQLQALVRAIYAAPNMNRVYYLIDDYRVTLDATTPAAKGGDDE